MMHAVFVVCFVSLGFALNLIICFIELHLFGARFMVCFIELYESGLRLAFYFVFRRVACARGLHLALSKVFLNCMCRGGFWCFSLTIGELHRWGALPVVFVQESLKLRCGQILVVICLY
jgi:hypothetical protein